MSESDEGGVYSAKTDVSDENSDNDSELVTQNPFSPLAAGGGHNGGSDATQASQSILGNGFQQVRNKRQRISTGGKSNETVISDLNLDEKVSRILSKMTDYDAKMAEINNKLDDSLRLKDKIQELENTVCLNIDRLTLLEYKSIDAEARSRRNNLIFGGFTEETNENCELTIRQFLREKLHLTDPIAIQRSHRLGRFSRQSQRRIIVGFQDYSDTELILSKAYLLRNTNYHINRDFPVEITNARKALWSEYKHLKTQSKSPKIVYPAKLMVGNHVVKDMFPQWNAIMRGSRVQTHGLRTQNNDHGREKPHDARAPRLPDRNINTLVPTGGETNRPNMNKAKSPAAARAKDTQARESSSRLTAERHHGPGCERRHRSHSKRRTPPNQRRHRSKAPSPARANVAGPTKRIGRIADNSGNTGQAR